MIFVFFLLFTGAIGSLDHNETVAESHASRINRKWEQYKKTYNKSYSWIYREQLRRMAWEDNCNLIEKHNAEAKEGLHTFTLGANSLADLSLKLYIQKMIKLTKSSRRRLPSASEHVGSFLKSDEPIPDEIDWREKGFITPSYNQRDCGSCYAFSIAHSIQGQVFKKTGKLIFLSEQQIVDCSISSGNFGCGGGSLRNTLRYLDKAGGLMLAEDYPYNAKQNPCHVVDNKPVVNITSWAILPARDEAAMKNTVASIGPIAVSINASPHTFQLYSKGIYDDIGCSSESVNHAMLVVGYTNEYWILKNWWGENWGEGGYMKLKRNKNRCGVSNYAAYSIV